MSNRQLCLAALQLAITDARLPVMEKPRYSNRGTRVDQYQLTAGVQPPEPYCASALFTWFHEACALTGAVNPLVRTGYCPDAVNHLRRAGRLRRRPVDAQPGDAIFYWMAHEGRFAHCGIVLKNNGDGTVQVVEANTNRSGAREGDGVYFKQRRVAGTRHVVADLQNVLGTVQTAAPVDANVTQMLQTSQLAGARVRPVKVAIDGRLTDVPAHSYLDRTYVAISPYAEAMRGRELVRGVFDGDTGTLNLVTKSVT